MRSRPPMWREVAGCAQRPGRGDVASRHGRTVAAAASPGPPASIRFIYRQVPKIPRTAKDRSSDANSPTQLPEDFPAAR